MKLFGKLTKLTSNQLTIQLDDDAPLFKLSKFASGRQLSTQVDVEDGRTITPDQRKKIWALIHDTADYFGDTTEYWEDRYKAYTRQIFGYERYSLSDCSVEVASNMILTILEFCFKQNVPFAWRTWDMLPNDYSLQWFCLRYRKCIICGKHADIAHEYAVGMGRNRHHMSHKDMYFMALCREHHGEQHQIGIWTFLNKYHIKPIKLDKEERIKLHIEGKNQNETNNNFRQFG